MNEYRSKNLRKSKDRYAGGFGGKKGKRDMLQLYIISDKPNNEDHQPLKS